MTGKQLKNSILQWAIQGKLVPQDPNDEPASVLLEKIRAEKARLIKEGKIKKDKKESIIYRGEDNSYYEKFTDGKVVCIDEEIPFEVPESWQWERWGNLSYSIQYGYNAPAEEAGDIRMVRISDIQDGEVLWATVPFCHINKSEIDTYLLQKDDILFARTGASVGKTYIYRELDGLVYYAGFLIRAHVNEDNNADFVYQNTLTEAYYKYIQITSQRSGQPGVNAKEYQEFTFFVPDKEEQDKISTFLGEIDTLITLHQRKCDETKTLKKYMLQKMFPQDGKKVPEIRFKGFTDDWEQRKLGEFGKATGGTSIESEFSEDGVYKVISIGSYSENSVYNDQGIRAIKSDKTSNRVLNRNDLTMILNDKTTSGNIIGRVLLIEESGIYVYNQRTERIEINLNEYDSVFLYEMLNAPNIREKIIKQAQGNTQIYVNWTAISLLEYMIPSKEEQAKIGNYFTILDHIITLHQRKCDELKEMKKYMLQNMFV